MKSYDFDFIEKEDKVVKPKNMSRENPNDFKGGDASSSVSFLLKYEAINLHFNLNKLLIEYGCNVTRTNMFCPFHDDEFTGKPSAKYHSESDMLYCFSESKNYTAFHALKLLYRADMEVKFVEAWGNLESKVKDDLLLKYSDSEVSGKADYGNPIWVGYRFVVEKFSKKEVDFKQHKNALYKLFAMIYHEEVKGNEIIQKLIRGNE